MTTWKNRIQHPWIAPVAVFLLALFVYLPAMKADFLLDDLAQIQRNPAVRDLDVEAIFTRGYWGNVTETAMHLGGAGDVYRPLATLSIAVSYRIWGDEPFGYHLENVLLHALASMLVHFVMRRWGLGRATSFVAAALFGVAPIHIEPMVSVVLRNELLAAIFGLLFLGQLAGKRPGFSALWLLGALLAKESAIALPFLALFVDRTFTRPRLASISEIARRYGPLAGSCLLYLVIRGAVLGRLTLGPEQTYFGPEVSGLVVWLTMARFAVEHYLSGALFGSPLVFDYSPQAYPEASTSDPVAWLCLGFWVVLVGGTLYFVLRRRARWAMGPVLFLLTIGPAANVVTRIGVIGATRLVYFPYLGIALALAQAGTWIAGRTALPGRRVLAIGLGIVVLAGLALQTRCRLAVCTDRLRFYHDMVEQVPRNALALGYLSIEEYRAARGRTRSAPEELGPHPATYWYERSLEHAGESLAIEPKNWPIYLRQFARTAVILGRERELLDRLHPVLTAGVTGLTLPTLPRSFHEWNHRPLSTAEAEALRAWGRRLQFFELTPAQILVLVNNARNHGLTRLSIPPTPEEMATVRRLVEHPLYQRAILHRLGRVLPDLLIARSLVPHVASRVLRYDAGLLSAAERDRLRDLLLRTVTALRRVQACYTEYDPENARNEALPVPSRILQIFLWGICGWDYHHAYPPHQIANLSAILSRFR